jgi:type II secretory pathway component HofQ
MKKLCIYLIGLALSVGLQVLPARAQAEPAADDWGPVPAVAEPAAAEEAAEGTVSLDFRAADIGDVLRALFRDSGASYVLSPDVKGRVTVSLNDVPFSVALRSVLDQVKATFRKEGNVYSVLLASAVSAGDEATTQFRTPQRLRIIEVRFASASEMAYLFGGTASGAYGTAGSFNANYGGNTGNRNNFSSNITNRSNTNRGNTNLGGGTNTGGGSNIGTGGGNYGMIGGGGGTGGF